MLTGGLEQSDWSPCTKTQLSHQCQWEVLDKLLGHPVHECDTAPLACKAPIWRLHYAWLAGFVLSLASVPIQFPTILMLILCSFKYSKSLSPTNLGSNLSPSANMYNCCNKCLTIHHTSASVVTGNAANLKPICIGTALQPSLRSFFRIGSCYCLH